MHFLQLAVGIALCLSWLAPSVVHSWTPYLLPLSEQQRARIVRVHNRYRMMVHPPAADMLKLFWSAELASEASIRALECNLDEPTTVATTTNNFHRRFKQHYTGENIGITSSPNITELLWDWFSERIHYSYVKGICGSFFKPSNACDRYLQMVCSTACEVGCAIAACPNLSPGYSPSVPEIPDFPSFSETKGTNFLVVCRYGPGFDSEEPVYKIRPYWKGKPCDKCPKGFDLCDLPSGSYAPALSMDNTEVGGEQIPPPTGGLCFNEAEMCLGSDPHFAIRLAGGHLLCYTFQGVYNKTFNLVSNDYLDMNALFVPDDTDWDNTWLGSIGITIFHEGKQTTTLRFTAADQLIRIGDRIQIEANAIKKLTFHHGKLTMLEVPSDHTPRYPRVQVQCLDAELNFTIGFAKNGHLDLYWHSAGVPYKSSRGIVGQFFQHGVNIDTDAKLLHMPGRPSVPIEKQELWKFMEQSFHSDSECWTSAYHSSQGAGIVAGSYEDYIVDGLLSIGH